MDHEIREIPTSIQSQNTLRYTVLLRVLCIEAVLFSEVSKCIITVGIAAFGTLSSVLYERLSFSRRVLYWRFHCIPQGIIRKYQPSQNSQK
jgi:hypothetical protein